MSDLVISIRRRTLRDQACAFDVELHQHHQTIALPCHDRGDAERLSAALAGIIEACACIAVITVASEPV